MIPRITIRETADADVIRKALEVYLQYRRVNYHRAAAQADVEESLQLSIAYESDKEYVAGLLRAVEDGTMVPVTDGGSGTDSEEGTNDE